MEELRRLSQLVPVFVQGYDGTGKAARWRHNQSINPLFLLAPPPMTPQAMGQDGVRTLVEQLDVAISTLRKESREVDWLRDFIATIEWEMAAITEPTNL